MEDFIDRLFLGFSVAPMFHVKKPPRSLARALELGLVPLLWRKRAENIIDSYERKPKWSKSARREDGGGNSWDNVVRAYEDVL